ncbi:MFS transporter [Desulfoluna spongiiphila]|uniref:MFS transporter n=1 Tax=Desulfoluna spongiiphila TaxID=419481 RepID=UPI001259E919|nr:glycoside-pentoside-hexuronide (GPH):cation symporter [Desulfoluna spongiiphila]VVS91914.1 sodium:galactoside symporter [Desulfoluna spongiiphila]
MKPGPESLPRPVKLAYALPAFAMAVVGIPVYIYIPKFYTDVMGLDIAVVGAGLLGLRLFDAVTDPVMGMLSDRTVTPFGRRRPYIAIGATILCLAIACLFNPPQLGEAWTTAWFFIWLALVFLSWTLAVVPYEALGPELTFDYHERTVLFGYRDGFLIAGTMVAAIVPVIIRTALRSTDTSFTDHTVFFIMSLVYIPLILVCCGICVVRVRENPTTAAPEPFHLKESLAPLLDNKPFGILVVAFAFSAIAAQMPATLILFYVEHVLESNRAELFLLLYFVSGVVFLPAWVRLARRIGKKAAWMASMAINTGAFFYVFWLGPGDEGVYGALVFVSGIGFGAGLALPSALTADVIDFDESLTGKRREGQYIGVFSVAKKMAGATGAGLGLWALGFFGYEAGQPQGPEAVFALRTLYALVPCLLSIVALAVAGFYPLSQKHHQEIMAQRPSP